MATEVKTEVDKLKEKGNQFLAAGKYQEAVAAYTQAIKIAPTNHLLYSNRSAAKITLADLNGALEDAQKCVELAPTWSKGYSRVGAAYQAMNKLDDALAAFTKGLSLEPTNSALQSGKQAVEEARAKSGAKTEFEYNPEVDPIVGIDLGTTYSCVGVWEGEGVVIIPDAEGRRTTPSVVSYSAGENGEVIRLVGHDAKRKMTTNAEGTIFDAKRLIGQRFQDEMVVRDVEKLPFKVESSQMDDKPRISIPSLKIQFTPEEISAVVLSEMKKIAEAYLKRPVTRAIVTVPAYFSDAQRQATKDAGQIAGLNVLRVINEPTAAALAYGLDSKTANEGGEEKDNNLKESKILVFDLGGGTFDVSVLSIENGVFEVMATGGDTHLGGEDFDNNVVEYFKKEIKNKYKVDVETKRKSRLKVAAENAKIALSTATTTRVALDGIIEGDNNFIEFTREKFDKLNEEPFKRCMETVKRVLKDAKLKPDQIRDVVLVGGSTRIPTIREQLRAYFGGKQLCQSINPDEVGFFFVFPFTLV
jgi:L1 cell adhesion molecule like protein